MHNNKKIKRDVLKDSPLTKSAFLPKMRKIPKDILDIAKEKKITIPVRIHDLETMRINAGTGCYEFHLSYEEVLSENLKNLPLDCKADEEYSIHLPDYIPNNRIFDPISLDEDIKKISKEILHRTESLANSLELLTGKSPNCWFFFSKKSQS